ncbi:E3 ubiquitin-protein ligase Bre1 isoform X1 [Dermacentor andersoni]|uniref:E3 ubiquitin-protein ligase Bre1 isoform X1 n=1 Tax=Dermacentor andersoni TaxID=34620 RepID=UPI0021558100|nr:E3 ubiquitin-protein ligase BRE1B-like isoform X1 [Dermacentor andersoni]
MASKRPAPQESPGGASSGPPPKKVHFEPFRIGQVSTLEEMDMKTLQFQNRKLAQRLEQRVRQENELRARVEQLEKRQTSDEGVLTVVNRYWNQLNEDLRILLQRFDSEAWDESEQRNEAEATTSFLGMLLHWDREELDEKLAQRVQVSTRAVAKLLQAFDRLVQRNHKVMLALQGEETPGADGEPVMDTGPVPDLNEAVRQANIELQTENKNLHALVTSLHEKNHKLTLKLSEHQDQVDSLQTKNDELRNRGEELEYELSKVRAREEKLDCNLADCLQRIKSFQVDGVDALPLVASGGGSGGGGGAASLRLEDLQSQLEEQRELASARLLELEQLQHDHKEALKTVERLRLELRSLPESLVVSTAEYKCLQSQFSVLYNESMQLKTQLDECRSLLSTAKNSHLRHIEQMESEELVVQKKLRSEVIRLEDNIAQIRREYENLRIEFESSSVSSEQAQPINREMRHIITSLQSHNRQLKSEVSRSKRKLREAQSETQKLRQMLEMSNVAVNSATVPPPPSASSDSGSTRSDDAPATPLSSGSSTSTVGLGGSAGGSGAGGGRSGEETAMSRHEEDCRAEEEPIPEREKGKSDADIIRDLKAQLKKSQEAQRELKLLLDMYKGAPKEQRDKVQLMAAEKKARAEAEEHRQQLKKLVEHERKERRKLADEDAMKKIRALEETVNNLHKGLAAQKQEHTQEEALLSEMEVTGQAFEDMQEQNLRLLQQLREKDDANFKLMSERIKSTQVHKLLQDEKVALMEQAARLQSQVEAQNQVVRKLEEKERLLQNSLSTVEKELSLRQQAAEVHRRKAVESAQSAADLKLHLEKYLAQLRDAQSIVTDRTAVLSQETFKTKRLQEEILSLRRKVERAKKFELATNTDEVLMEEVKEYKEQLTCPSCKVKRKDAVLIKCFHVFCYDCLKTRYETRQRKCPKCNAPFGTNDYHRLYLT